MTLKELLEDYNYECLFNNGLRGEYDVEFGNGSLVKPEKAPIISKVNDNTFDENDVCEIYHAGTNGDDEPSFAVIGNLKDGRFFSIVGWKDYSGWG